MDDYEVIGFDDGDDGDEVGAFPINLSRMFGGARRAAPKRRVMVRRAAPARASTQGRRIIASTQRVRYLPLGTVSVAVSNTGQLQATAEGPIQGSRLCLVTGASRGAVRVTNIRIGTRSQLEGTESIPIEAFREDAQIPAVILDPVQTGQSVTIDLANDDPTTAAVVTGVLIGVTGS